MADDASEPIERAWPALPYAEVGPFVAYLRRLVQVGVKYTLDQLYEPSWGNIVLGVTGRGLSTPPLYAGAVSFTVHYRLLDDDVVIEANTGQRHIALADGTVSDFYRRFCAAADALGLPAPGSAIGSEIPNAAPLDADDEPRVWDRTAARAVWQSFDAVAQAFVRYQAPYRAYRPRVGVMWGGFDLSATRYKATSHEPPTDRPIFQQNGMGDDEVALGFALPGEDGSPATVYAYISPEPDGLDSFDFGVDGASWQPTQGLVVLPWDAVRAAAEPGETIVAFADAVYAAAIELGGWPRGLVGERRDGWHAGRYRMPPPADAPTADAPTE